MTLDKGEIIFQYSLEQENYKRISCQPELRILLLNEAQKYIDKAVRINTYYNDHLSLAGNYLVKGKYIRI